MSFINIAGKCAVQIEPSMGTLTTEYQHHLQNDDGGLPVVGNVKTDINLHCPPDAVMLLDHRLFTDFRVLYIIENGKTCKLELTNTTFVITINGNDTPCVLPVLVQTMLNFYMPKYGLVFLHTAAYKMKDEVVAISGFGGAGKTETMLTMLQRGAMYLSDDLAIFDTRGRLLPYLRRISLHDYPFTESQLQQFNLSRWRFYLMNHCKHKAGRLPNYLYRRFRGHFNINIDYTELTDGIITPVNQAFVVNRHYWLDSCNVTRIHDVSKNQFIENMTFCMHNEFRAYMDFDGYCGTVFPFWKSIRTLHQDALQNVLDTINIQGLTINGQDYKGIANLLYSI